MLLSPMQPRLGFTPKGICSHTLYIKVLGKNNVVDHLVYTIHQGVTVWFIYRGKYGIYVDVLQQKGEVSLKIGTVVKHDFAWMWVPALQFLIEQLA